MANRNRGTFWLPVADAGALVMDGRRRGGTRRGRVPSSEGPAPTNACGCNTVYDRQAGDGTTAAQRPDGQGPTALGPGPLRWGVPRPVLEPIGAPCGGGCPAPSSSRSGRPGVVARALAPCRRRRTAGRGGSAIRCMTCGGTMVATVPVPAVSRSAWGRGGARTEPGWLLSHPGRWIAWLSYTVIHPTPACRLSAEPGGAMRYHVISGTTPTVPTLRHCSRRALPLEKCSVALSPWFSASRMIPSMPSRYSVM